MVLCFVAVPVRTFGQMADPDQAPPAVEQGVAERPVSWKLLLPNLLQDQERIWSFPGRLVRGHDWIGTAAVLGTTAGLVGLDPAEAAYFHRTSAFHGFNNVFTGNATEIGTIVAPLSLYGIGLIRGDSKMKRTALLAGEAVADVEILTTVLKDATKRVRPIAVPDKGNFSDTWFDSSGSFLRGKGSFPSGHTIAAFAVATVVARRYGNHRWVPYAAYGLAAAVGLSRLSLSSHFASDVFLGGALGYSISRFTVLRQ
jgi:membrane-associated phospholipid phosphatase